MQILLTGGGTLGSVTPLLATAEAIKKLEPSAGFVWVGTRAGIERTLVAESGISYRWIFAGKLRRYVDLRNAIDPFFILLGFLQSVVMVIARRPTVVISAGGFVAVPLIWAAWLMRIPIVIHQEDVEVGLANKISAPFARALTATFAESCSAFEERRVTVIGNPVRALIALLADPSNRIEARVSARLRWNLSESKPCLLVLGGGTGAQELNERIVRVMPSLIDHMNILHLTGKGKSVEVEGRHGYVQVEFLTTEMAEAYAVADLAVTRAGLGTLTELGVVGVPPVLVPLPGQQELNARLLTLHGAGVTLEQSVSDQVFTSTILSLMNDRDRRAEITRAGFALFPADAAMRLARIALEVT